MSWSALFISVHLNTYFGSFEYLFHTDYYTDDKSTSAILNIISQGVNIRNHNFKIIEAVSKYILESNRFT